MLNLDVGALEQAVDAGLLDIGAGVRFRHPLLRSAVYRAARVDEGRAAHAALAEATPACPRNTSTALRPPRTRASSPSSAAHSLRRPCNDVNGSASRWRSPNPQSDPDRRAWHRAYAAEAADEEVAAELIGSADRAGRRGGVAAAAAFWERAVALTPDPGRRAARALVAAEAKYAAGDFAATAKLLAAADIGPLDQQGHARAERLRVQIEFGLQVAFLLNNGSDAPLLLFQAAQRLLPPDPVLALETLLEALVAGLYAGRLAGEASRR